MSNESAMEHNELCLRIATEAHDGQMRRGGEPYINHPIRVANAFPVDSYRRSIAYLHDVLEDCSEWTGKRLALEGVFPTVYVAVELLTKKPGQDYDDYLDDVREINAAREVKIADMLDNLTDSPTPKQVEKYKKGILYLAN